MDEIKLSGPTNRIIKGIEFEKIIVSLFKKIGYNVEYNDMFRPKFDMLVSYGNQYENKKYKCEIKFYSKLKVSNSIFTRGISQLENVLEKEEVGLFIVNTLCDEEFKKWLLEKKIIILDISNLLYLINSNDKIYQKLLELLDFSVVDVSPMKPDIPFNLNILNNKNNNDLIAEWKESFERIKPGHEDFSKYEKLCIKALKLLFSDYLSIWKEQQKSNADLYKFDLICKIKNNTSDDFFDTLKKYFNTKYIVFEFKNYTDKISQKEIYTTEKYLYDKALRKAAIIISRKGPGNHAIKAIKGSLREQGKVIITLTDEDILKMIGTLSNDNGENASDYLAELLDKLLIELEK